MDRNTARLLFLPVLSILFCTLAALTDLETVHVEFVDDPAGESANRIAEMERYEANLPTVAELLETSDALYRRAVTNDCPDCRQMLRDWRERERAWEYRATHE